MGNLVFLVWKDLENQAMVAVSRDLTRQGCNAIPNYRIRVITGLLLG